MGVLTIQQGKQKDVYQTSINSIPIYSVYICFKQIFSKASQIRPSPLTGEKAQGKMNVTEFIKVVYNDLSSVTKSSLSAPVLLATPIPDALLPDRLNVCS